MRRSFKTPRFHCQYDRSPLALQVAAVGRLDDSAHTARQVDTGTVVFDDEDLAMHNEESTVVSCGRIDDPSAQLQVEATDVRVTITRDE